MNTTVKTEDEVIPASGTEMRVADVAAFCVIGPSVNNSFGRTWKKTQAEAAKHARKLINQSVDSAGNPKTRKLFVVQVVEVIEVPGPTLISRRLEEDDTSGE